MASDDTDGPGEGVELLAAVDLLDLSDLWPAAGDTVATPPGMGRHTPRWSEHRAGDGAVDLGSGGSETPRTAVLAAYVEVDRFRSLEISARSAHLLRLFVDNRQVAAKTAVDSLEEEDAEPGVAKATVHLTQGKHIVMVQTVYAPSGPPGWRVEGAISPTGDGDDASLDGVAVTLSREHGVQIGDLLDVASVQGVSISADGRFAAVAYAFPAVPAEHRERWVDVHRLDGSDRPVLTLPDIGGIDFGPVGSGGARYAYTVSGGAGTEIWVGDFGDAHGGPARRVLGPDENLRGFEWRGDGRSLFVTLAEESPDESATEKAGLVRRRSLPDRWPGWRDRAHVYELALATDESGVVRRGLMRRLTGGDEAVSLVTSSPDGAKLLFSSQEIVPERPFLTSHFYEMDMADLSLDDWGRLDGIADAVYSPDGRWLLVQGTPSSFGGAGLALPEGTLPNDYEGEAFLLDLTADDPLATARALTRDFDPSVSAVRWTPDGQGIYLQVTTGERTALVRMDPGTGVTRSLDLGFDSVDSMAISEDGSRLVAAGSWADRPERVVTLDLESASAAPRLLADPGRERYDHVTIGAVEDFSCTSDGGAELIGRVHLPPGYDPQAPAGTYPAIVNVYGGVVPVGRSFGGRYPRNLWTAHGYVVLHVQPSGSVGFGQEFAARHVGDWGRINAQEVIEGTRAFLDAYPSVDSERVGLIGASYGGFMTMYTLSATDLFATGIAHAGISSLSSYWGEGWWGYLYSAVASGESFPWNDPDLYVEQSPLFRADKIESPLLLLHGTADTNVPPGESEQLYTALELLGRDVELIEIEGQGHHVLQYPKRVLWMETIVAWFDKYLKDQPEWWEHLYPDGE
jgi:dipeptidyl aminopeptidase/acylaminoacyl peptidase